MIVFSWIPLGSVLNLGILTRNSSSDSSDLSDHLMYMGKMKRTNSDDSSTVKIRIITPLAFT